MNGSINKIIAVAGAAAMLVSVAACGGNSTNNAQQGGGDSSTGGTTEITVWAWETTLTQVVKDFEKANPDIKVKLVNSGQGNKTYTALTNALNAGSGAPDVAQIEYYALPNYAIDGALQDITDKTSGYDSFYTPGTWSSVQWGGKVYALPMDSGPMAFFYNKEVFDKAGITEAPKTWDEFYQDAKKIHALGDDYYITSDTGDAGFYDSMTWLAGAKPFETSADGKTVTINLTGDEKVKEFNEFWQKLLDEGLLDTKTAGWSEDWFKGMSDGTIASLITGAWMPANLANSAPGGAGKWRVAPTPTADGSATNSENGGSSLAVLASSKKQDAALKFIEYANHGDGVATRVAGGAFPADTESLKSDSFINATTVKNADGEDVDYFGGQKYNEVLAQAAENVSTDYQFLPFEVYARGKFGDFVGKSYTGDQKLSDGVAAWQQDLKSYAEGQGFEVK